MLPILLALALAAPGEKDCLRVGERCDPNSGRGLSQPWFQAFPVSGAGVANTCDGGVVTGAKGEALSETRSTVQGCIDETTGTGCIVPANTLCVVQGGTTAAQGSFQQYMVRTEEFDNASWTKGASVGTITQNYGISPVGTLTAERYQYSNTNGDYILQSFSVGTAAANCSLRLKGTSGSGTLNLCRGGAAGQCVSCAYSSSAWSTCQYPGALSASTNCFIGCDTPTLGSACSQTGLDVLIWGFNATLGNTLRPYIPATTAAVTTGAEVTHFTLTNAPALASSTITVDTPASMGSTPRLWHIYKDANNQLIAYANSLLYCWYIVGGVSYTGASAAGIPLSTKGVKLSCSYDGTNVIACVNGSCNSTAKSFTLFTGATKFAVGEQYGGGFEANPMQTIKYVAADTSPTRFR